jgi:hypothetical protein
MGLSTVAPGEAELRFSDVGYLGAMFVRDNMDSVGYVLGRTLPAGVTFSIFLELIEYTMHLDLKGTTTYEYMTNLIIKAIDLEFGYDVSSSIRGDGYIAYDIEMILLKTRTARYRIISRIRNAFDVSYNITALFKTPTMVSYEIVTRALKTEHVDLDMDVLILKAIQQLVDINMYLMKTRSSSLVVVLKSILRNDNGFDIDMKVPA